MNYHIPNLDMTPPGGWRYFVPETKTWFRNYLALSDLVSALGQHYRANQLVPPSGLEQRIINAMCPELPPNWCQYEGSAKPPVSRPLTFNDVVTGTRILLSWQMEGRPKVSPEEADRRAEICARCDRNVQPSGCPTCNSPLRKIVEAFVGAEKTKYDNELRVCRECGCSLKAKIWFPLDLLQTDKTNLPDWCWLK